MAKLRAIKNETHVNWMIIIRAAEEIALDYFLLNFLEHLYDCKAMGLNVREVFSCYQGLSPKA